MDGLNIQDSTDNLPLNKEEELQISYKINTLPSLVDRIKALFIDAIIMLIIFTATTLFIDSFGDMPGALKGFILIFMLYLYDPVLTALTGSTLGHKMMKLKVRKYNEPDRNISLPQAFLRFLIKGSLGWVSFLTVTGNKNKRAIHDLASGSIILIDK